MKKFAVLFSGVVGICSLFLFVLFNDYTNYLSDEVTLFNAATLAYQEGRTTDALIGYHQVALITPRDAEVQGFIADLLQRTDTVLPSHENLIVQVAAFASTLLNLRELAYLTWFSLVLSCFLLTIRNFRWTKTLLPPTFLLVLLLTSTLAARLYQQAFVPRAVIVMPNTPVYTGANDDYFILFTLNSPQIVYVDTHSDAWAKVYITPQRIGWVHRDALRWLDPQP